MRLRRLAVGEISKVILRQVLDRTLASWTSIRAANSVAVSQVVRHGQDLECRHTAVFVVSDALKSGVGAEKAGLLLLFGRRELVVIHVQELDRLLAVPAFAGACQGFAAPLRLEPEYLGLEECAILRML